MNVLIGISIIIAVIIYYETEEDDDDYDNEDRISELYADKDEEVNDK